jgi:hypothetical protein
VIEVPTRLRACGLRRGTLRSHQAVFKILFDKKIFLDRTGPTNDPSEHYFGNYYRIGYPQQERKLRTDRYQWWPHKTMEKIFSSSR